MEPPQDRIRAKQREALSRLRNDRPSIESNTANVYAPQVAPLSALQHSLWVHEQVEATPGIYTNAVAHVLRGVDAAALNAALHDVIAHQPTLRTSFIETDGRPAQIVGPVPEQPLAYAEHLLPTSAEIRERMIVEFARDEAQRPLDLRRGGFRALLASIGGDEAVLVFTIHHLVADGWSIGLIFRELEHAYTARVQGRAPGFVPLRVSYLDWSAEAESAASTVVAAEALAYWRAALIGAPPVLELSNARARPETASHQSSTITTQIDTVVAGRLSEAARLHGATAFVVLLASWIDTLRRHSAHEKFVVGTVFANRMRTAIEPVVGLFANSVLVCVDVRQCATVSDLINATRDAALASFSQPQLPLERIVEALNPRRQFGLNPLFQATFALQNAGDDELELAGVETRRIALGSSRARFDIGLTAWEGRSGLTAALQYARDLFSDASARDLLETFESSLGRAVGGADGPLAHRPRASAHRVRPVRSEPGSVHSAVSPPRHPRPPEDRAVATIVAAIWADVLGETDPSWDKNFFDLGGTSARLLELRERLRSALAREIDLMTLFKYPTIRTLAEHLAEVVPSSETQERVSR